MGVSAAFLNWKMAYQITPIILTGGIAAQSNGLPIVVLTNGTQYANNAGGSSDPAYDDFFANYEPVPGSTLISNQVAMYPFANQAVAANAIISQPLRVSMLMRCPASGHATNTNTSQLYGYTKRQSIMMRLQKSLAQHNGLGGMYTVVTPSFIYTDCLMLEMRDVSSGESHQAQMMYQLDFVKPLVSLQAAAQAYNGLIQTLSNGTKPTGTPAWSQGLPVTNPTNTLTSSVAQSQLA